jgi:hypothetical protein
VYKETCARTQCVLCKAYAHGSAAVSNYEHEIE